MRENGKHMAKYCERGVLTVIAAPRPLLEETLAALFLREPDSAVLVTCGRVRDDVFVQVAAACPGVSLCRAGTPAQLTAHVRTHSVPLLVVIHDPEVYEDDAEDAGRVTAMLREYAWSCANRIVILARPGDAYLDLMWPYAGRYLSIVGDGEWRNGRMTCDRQMTLDMVGDLPVAGQCQVSLSNHY